MNSKLLRFKTTDQSSASAIDYLAIIPWLLFPYDSLTYLLGADINVTAQTLPLTAVFSVLYLIFRAKRLSISRESFFIFLCLISVFFITAFITTINVLWELFDWQLIDSSLRSPAALRQALSMVLGICSFLMFQDSLLRIGLACAMKFAVFGLIPSFLLGFQQILSGEYRVQGFSSEPSHFADLLVFLLFPACFLADIKRHYKIILLVAGMLLLLGTYSTTGVVKWFFLIVIFFSQRRQLLRGIFWLSIFVSSSFLILSLNPDNYIFNLFSYMVDFYDQTGQIGTASFIDRFFGFVGPVSMLDRIHAWFGYGFGGDAVYFYSLFSPEVANEIREVKGELPSISSLQGKMLMYGGVSAYLLYLTVWCTAYRLVPVGNYCRVMLPTVFISSLFSLAPFFLPYVWLWLAAASISALDRK